jgi:hypothetical protein
MGGGIYVCTHGTKLYLLELQKLNSNVVDLEDPATTF